MKKLQDPGLTVPGISGEDDVEDGVPSEDDVTDNNSGHAFISKIASWYTKVRGGTRRYPGHASITQPKSSQRRTKKKVRE